MTTNTKSMIINHANQQIVADNMYKMPKTRMITNSAIKYVLHKTIMIQYDTLCL